MVCCGEPAQDLELFIVDPDDGAALPNGVVGEVCIRGPNVSPGYWGDKSRRSKNSLLHTGDLGIFQDGKLYITGRLKDLIIVRGRNIYPQDIESAAQVVVQNAPENSCVAVTHREKLVLIHELSPSQAKYKHCVDLAASITSRISELFEVRIDRVIFTRSNFIPRTNSGKISRSALALLLDEANNHFIFDTANKPLELT